MKTDDVPQEPSPTHLGVKKLLYAVNAEGDYRAVKSAGWTVEAEATMAAVDEFVRLRDEAWATAKAGRASPLAYHMYRLRMDPATLAAAAGVWRWRLLRHLRPAIFAKLADDRLKRYAEALGMTVDGLRQLPDRPDRPDG